jgi:hypothetical protein
VEQTQVYAVEFHQIEAPDAKGLLAVVARVERAEIRSAVFSAGDDLAIDDRTPARESQQRVANAWEAVGELVTILRIMRWTA